MVQQILGGFFFQFSKLWKKITLYPPMKKTFKSSWINAKQIQIIQYLVEHNWLRPSLFIVELVYSSRNLLFQSAYAKIYINIEGERSENYRCFSLTVAATAVAIIIVAVVVVCSCCHCPYMLLNGKIMQSVMLLSKRVKSKMGLVVSRL